MRNLRVLEHRYRRYATESAPRSSLPTHFAIAAQRRARSCAHDWRAGGRHVILSGSACRPRDRDRGDAASSPQEALWPGRAYPSRTTTAGLDLRSGWRRAAVGLSFGVATDHGREALPGSSRRSRNPLARDRGTEPHPRRMSCATHAALRLRPPDHRHHACQARATGSGVDPDWSSLIASVRDAQARSTSVAPISPKWRSVCEQPGPGAPAASPAAASRGERTTASSVLALHANAAGIPLASGP